MSLSWASLAYLLASAMFLVPFGKLADIHGRKKVFVFGIGTFTASSLLLATISSAATLILLRALQGVGTAMIFGTGIAILVSVYPAEDKGMVLGANAAAVYVGLSIGPFIGGLLTESLGWRSIFYVGVALGLTIFVSTTLGLAGEWTEAEGERFDLVGSAIYSLTLLSLMYGFSLIPSPESVLPLMLGAAGFPVMIRWEARAKSPILDISLFRGNRAFTFSNLAAMINYSATYAVTFLLSLYLQYLKGLNAEQAGLLLVSQPIVQAVFSPVTGRLSDRSESRKVASLGMAATIVGLFPFVFMDEGTTWVYITIGLALLGFGLALFVSPNTNAIMSSVERRFYGVASATLGTMRLIGQMLSMGITMVIFETYIGRVEITPAVYPMLLTSIKTAFVVFSILCACGVFASLVRGKRRSESVNA